MDAYEEISSADSYFRYSYQRLNHKVLLKDIYYFESRRENIHSDRKGMLEFYENSRLRKPESRRDFSADHQSFLVNYRLKQGLARLCHNG